MTEALRADQPGDHVVFRRLRAEAFRGFASPIEFALDASVVIVHGPNGLGKTSLFDALQWVLLGDLPRLRGVRTRPSDEYIVNAYRAGQKSTVSLEMTLNGLNVTLRREGDRNGSLLTWVEDGGAQRRGDDAASALAAAFGGGPELDISSAMKASGLLQQDAAREVLTAKPRERFDIFSQLLGLGDLADIEHWAESRYKQQASILKDLEGEVARAEQRTSSARERLRALREAAAVRPPVRAVSARLGALLQDTPLIASARAVESRDAAVAVAASAASLAREASEIASSVEHLRAEATARNDSDPEEDLAAVAATRNSIEHELAEARRRLALASETLVRLREAQVGLSRMASAVLPLLTGPRCPVCEQAVDERALRARLKQLEGTVAAAPAEEQVQDSAADVRRLESALVTVRAREAEVADAIADREAWERQRAATSLRLARLRDEDAPVRLNLPTFDLLDSTNVWREIANGAAAVGSIARELVAAWDASASTAEAAAVSELEQAEANSSRLQENRLSMTRARTAAANLHEAVRNARLDVVRQEFARLSPLAQDIYSRLDPHPTFQDIDLVSELFRSVGTTVAQVRDEQTGVTADPMVVFSSAQANIAAISYVVALNAASSVGPPVLLLDDPVQAMDDVNVLGLADLFRHVRRRRQIILSTHERRFANLLERKLAPRAPGDRTVTIEFVGWDRSGPQVKHHTVDDQLAQLSPVFIEATRPAVGEQ